MVNLLDFKDIFDTDVSKIDVSSLKKGFNSVNFDDDADVDYVEYFKILGRCCSDNVKNVYSYYNEDNGVYNNNCNDDDVVDDDDGDDIEEEEEGQEDPEYKMFREKVVVDETSYMLKRDGKVDIRFESVDDSDDESCDFNESEENVEELGSDSESVRRNKGGVRLDRISRNAEDGKVERRGKNVKNVDKGKGVLHDERDGSVEQLGSSSEELGKRKRWSRSNCTRVAGNGKENGKLERREKSFEILEEETSFMRNGRDRSMEEVDISSEKLGNVFYKRKRCASTHSSRVDFESDYRMFIDNCSMEGDVVVLNLNGRIVKYGECGECDDKSLSDSGDVVVLDHAPDCVESNYSPASNAKVRDGLMEEADLQCRATENPQFRKEVMDILKRPYDEKEYKRLLHDVNLQKPTERHVDVRSRIISFEQTTMGKSYLDHYEDLRRQLRAFKGDLPKRLNILRGFFFFLQKMPDDGKFKPWLDESCLAVVPR